MGSEKVPTTLSTSRPSPHNSGDTKTLAGVGASLGSETAAMMPQRPGATATCVTVLKLSSADRHHSHVGLAWLEKNTPVRQIRAPAPRTTLSSSSGQAAMGEPGKGAL